jgi:hypothetical protein
MAPRDRIEAFLPLTPPMLHTLVALARVAAAEVHSKLSIVLQ